MTGLSRSSKLGRLGSALAMVSAAIDVSRAIGARRMPASDALKTLGIDEKTFRQIRFG